MGLLLLIALAASLGAAGAAAVGEEPAAAIRQLVDAGRYADAEAAGRAALAAVEAQVGPDDLAVAEVLDPLVFALFKGGKNGDPETVGLAERAVAIRERQLGPEHPDLAYSMSLLASVLYLNADYARAQPLMERSLDVRRKHYGSEHPEVAASLGSLANLHADLGDVARARTLYEQAIEIEGRAGTAHRRAIYQGNLATLLLDMGDAAGAAALHEQVVAVHEQQLGADHPELAIALGNLAAAVDSMGDLDRARALEERALEIREAKLGPDHRLVAHGLTHLGRILTQQGDFEAARPLLERALRTREAGLGPDHPVVAVTLVALGELSLATGDVATARRRYERALEIRLARLGPDHPDVARCLRKLAELDLTHGQTQRGIGLGIEAIRITREQFSRAAAAVSEREALNLSSLLAESLDVALDGISRAEPAAVDPSAVWDALIRSRAIVLDEMARRHRGLLERSGEPEVAATAAALEGARRRLARLLLAGPPTMAAPDFAARLREAQEQVDAADRALARVSADYRNDLGRSSSGLAEVRAALPREAGLVGYALTRGSYVAFVLGWGANRPRVVSLGPSDAIERRVREWRERVGTPPRTTEDIEAYRVAGAALRRAIWDPVARELTGARLVFLVPDGALNLVSFGTLPLDGERYLVEGAQRVHYLSAERDLVSHRNERVAQSVGEGGVLVLGGPDYERGSDAARAAPAPGARDGSFHFRSALPDCESVRTLRFAALPGAEAEAGTIEKLWSKTAKPVLKLSGAAAGEAEFKANASGRSVLHLATHAFWVQGPCDGSDRNEVDLPLVLAGLALAGANRRGEVDPPASREDGVLTAEEIATLDLRGVDWAVLSGCQSGLGYVHRGEGVFGLRRAFQVAGAGTLVLTLWPVSDQDTRGWMQQLYRARLAGADTPTSMVSASRAVLASRRRGGRSTHPFFWGAFVAAGDWK